MTRTSKLVGTILFVGAVALVAWAMAEHQAEKAEESAQKRKSPQAPLSVSIEQGNTVLTIDSETQERMGLEIAPLRAAENRGQMRATALVLPPQDLAELRSAYLTAEANVAKARSSVEVEQREYYRLKLLNQENQNVSDKAVQSAEGTVRAAQADFAASEQQLRLQRAVIAQRWGSTVAEWLINRSPAFERIIEQKDWLVQATLPADSKLPAPERVSFELSGGTAIAGIFVSPYPRIDPRIQGTNFLYKVSDHPGLAAGLNLLANLPVGRFLHGVIVPESAVVWWEGQAWAYKQTGDKDFVRQPIPSDMAVRGGWFVPTGFAPNDKVVVRGAQALLSAETRPATGATGEEQE